MQSGDPTFDALQADLKDAKASGDVEYIHRAQEAVNQYAQQRLRAAQQAYMDKFIKGLSTCT